MIKVVFSCLLFLVPLMGMGQSARKTNKRLQAEYTALLKTHDSLYSETAVLYGKVKSSYKELRAVAEPVRVKFTDGGKLYSRWGYLSDDLELLNVGYSTNVSLKSTGKALETRAEKIEQQLADASRSLVLDEKRNFPAVFPGKSSMEKQNAWLTLRISEVGEENGLLEALNKRFVLANTTFDQAYPAFEGLSKTLDSLSSVLETEIKSLEKQKEEARANYALKGPDGFNRHYERIFWDVFPKEPSDIAPSYPPDQWSVAEAPFPPPKAPEKSENVIHSFVDEPAEFPGGMAALKKFIADNLKYPETAAELAIEGKCYLQFTVSAKGNISNVKVMRGVPDCPDCDREAVRLVEIMPNWIPGKIQGKPVESTFNLPVKFAL